MGVVQLKPEEIQKYGYESFTIPISKVFIKGKLKPLTMLSLSDLREWYHKFKFASKGTNYMFITLRTFEEIGLVSKFIARAIFHSLEEKKVLNFYEIYFIAIWTSHSTLNEKVKFILVLMNGLHETLDFENFSFVFIHTINALRKVMSWKMSLSLEQINMALKKAFIWWDLDNKGAVDHDDIKLWIKFNKEFYQFLKEFDSGDSLRKTNYTLKPFRYASNFSFFEAGALDTNKGDEKFAKSKKKTRLHRSTSTPKLVSWKMSQFARSKDKFGIQKARKILKQNHFKDLVNMSKLKFEDALFLHLIKNWIFNICLQHVKNLRFS